MHVRRQVRDLAVTTITGLTTTGGRIFSTRLFPLGQTDLPCWVVSTGDETVETVTMAMGGVAEQERSMALEFDGYARGVATVENTLEAMAAELETAMLPSIFSALVKSIYLESMEPQLSAEDLDNAFGIMSVVYRVIYHTTQGAPETAI
jgi:hypothetical protein